jgi:hypothetical protein
VLSGLKTTAERGSCNADVQEVRRIDAIRREDDDTGIDFAAYQLLRLARHRRLDQGSVGRIDPIGLEELPGDTACRTLRTPYQDLPAPRSRRLSIGRSPRVKTRIGS